MNAYLHCILYVAIIIMKHYLPLPRYTRTVGTTYYCTYIVTEVIVPTYYDTTNTKTTNTNCYSYRLVPNHS